MARRKKEGELVGRVPERIDGVEGRENLLLDRLAASILLLKEKTDNESEWSTHTTDRSKQTNAGLGDDRDQVNTT